MKTALCPSWICSNMLMMGWSRADIRTWTDINLLRQGKGIPSAPHFLFSLVRTKHFLSSMTDKACCETADSAQDKHISQNTFLTSAGVYLGFNQPFSTSLFSKDTLSSLTFWYSTNTNLQHILWCFLSTQKN